MAKSVFKWVPIKFDPIDIDGLDNALSDLLLSERDWAGKQFAKTTRTWNHRVAWNETSHLLPRGDKSAEISTKDFVYCLLDAGPRKKSWIIRAKRGKALRFQGKYRSKTFPERISSNSGGGRGNFIYRRIVRHRGFLARRWAYTIAKGRIPTFRNNVQRVFDRWL